MASLLGRLGGPGHSGYDPELNPIFPRWASPRASAATQGAEDTPSEERLQRFSPQKRRRAAAAAPPQPAPSPTTKILLIWVGCGPADVLEGEKKGPMPAANHNPNFKVELPTIATGTRANAGIMLEFLKKP